MNMAPEDWPAIVPLVEDTTLPVVGQAYYYLSESLPYDFAVGAQFDRGKLKKPFYSLTH